MKDLSLPFILLAVLLISSALGIVFAKKPVHACLSFLVTLMTLASLYLELDAQFVAVMQILVYAGAILVIFMFVVVLFQDAHEQLAKLVAQSSPWLLSIAGVFVTCAFAFFSLHVRDLPKIKEGVSPAFGTVEALGEVLYIDFFFPFEAVILLFLIAIIGSLYIAKKLKGSG